MQAADIADTADTAGIAGTGDIAGTGGIAGPGGIAGIEDTAGPAGMTGNPASSPESGPAQQFQETAADTRRAYSGNRMAGRRAPYPQGRRGSRPAARKRKFSVWAVSTWHITRVAVHKVCPLVPPSDVLLRV